LLEIRPFRKGFDEEIYRRIFNAAFADYDDIRSMTLHEVRTLEEAPSFNLDGLLIAEWNGQTAGMVQALVDKFREEKKGFIQSLAVLPEFRRRGIARSLVAKAIASLKERGMKVASAWVQTDRLACVHLYESYCFKRVRAMSLMKGSLTEAPPEVGGEESVCLREARIGEDEEIALINGLDNEAFKEHFNYRPMRFEETKYSLLKNPTFQDKKAWFAVVEDKPVGFVVAGIDAGLNREKCFKCGWILSIGVLKPYRRKGAGSTLMLQAMRYLKSLEMENALLYVDDENPTCAMKLYEKVGFKVFRKNAVYELPLL
jgi:mycothiol synthase